MAMTLNLTLVVQMFHFLIAYYFISKVLLKPVYEAIKSDENRARQLRALVDSEQERLRDKKAYQKMRWQLCQNYFYKHKPSLEQKEVALYSQKMIESPHLLTEARVESEAQAISKALKQKVLS